MFIDSLSVNSQTVKHNLKLHFVWLLMNNYLALDDITVFIDHVVISSNLQ